MITVDCVADLHGLFPKLEGGDLLIVAGDLTATDDYQEWKGFFTWINKQNYTKKIVICGNHDRYMEYNPGYMQERDDEFTYLCDSGTEFEYEVEFPHPASTDYVSIDVLCFERRKLKIWGSPWTLRFEGMNPNAMAFTVDTEEELAEKFALIPDDVDILVTHSPPLSMRDYRPFTLEEKKNNFFAGFGSKSLADRIHEIDDKGDGKKRLLVCGHIHEGYGVLNVSNWRHDKCTWKIVNASHVNERYEPVNKPIRITL